MLSQAKERLRGEQRAVAAMEFALIAPVMGMLVIGVTDISRAMIMKQEVYNAAHAIAVVASTQAVQADGSTTLTPTSAQTSMSTLYAEIPWLRNGIESGLRAVTLTSITFTKNDPTCNQNTTTCSYTPHVVWSAYYRGGVSGGNTNSGNFVALLRSCGTQTAVAPDTYIDINNNYQVLKTANINNPQPILIADVGYQFSPYLPAILNQFLAPQLIFLASVPWPVRSIPITPGAVQYTTYNLGNAADSAGVKCPGY